MNYVFVFYNAMAIFARKHFSQQHAATYSAIIKLAIWIRAFVAILNRFIKRISLPLADAGLLYVAMVAIKNYYATTQHKIYDAALVVPAFISYIAVWMMAVWLAGGYDRPLKPLRTLKPVAIGTAIILIAYSLLPEDLRFSRALILLTMLAAAIVFLVNRTLWNLLIRSTSGWGEQKDGNVVIVGSKPEVQRVRQLLEQIQRKSMQVLEVQPTSDNTAHEHSLTNLEEIIRVHAINQIIYCAHDMSSSEIIASMSSVSDKRVEFKIVPPESLYIIGSGSIETAGDAFLMDVNSIHLTINRRKKRLFDVNVSIVVLLISPAIIWFQQKPFLLYANLVKVLSGRNTWVSYGVRKHNGLSLPRLKPGILPVSRTTDAQQTAKMDVLYAKDYRLTNDLRILMRDWSYIGS